MLTPDQYQSTSVYDLLEAASRGQIGFDHRVLHAIVDRGEEGVAELVRWGTEDHEDSPIDLEPDLIAICRHLKSPAAVPFLVHCVKLHPEDIDEELFASIYDVRQAALEPLLALYEELDEEQSGEVAFLLASFRISDERVMKILLERLEFDAGDGALSLGVYGDPAAKPNLEKILAQATDPHLRSDIEDSIAQLGRVVEHQTEPFDLWDEYQEVATPAFELLTEEERLAMLDSDSVELRTSALSSFVNREVSDGARRRILELAKDDPAPEVRGAAWEALNGELDDKVIRKLMFDRLANEETPLAERSGALVGLASEVATPAVRPFAEAFYKNPETRAKAMEAMYRSLDRSFAEFFPPHLDDENPELVRQAIWGIGYLGITGSSEKLVPFMDDDNFRTDALFAYSLSARHEISKGRIHGLLRKVDEVAGGLNPSENELVRIALDERLVLHGHKPVFFPDGEEAEEAEASAVPTAKVGRNDPCPCGSGKKFKKCCGQ